MPRKLILCRCEDVTAGDIEHAVRSGYAELEEVKRYTGFGTGPCQGKECLRVVALAIAAAAGRAPDTMRPFTTRPPLAPTELRVLARPTDATPGVGRSDDDDTDDDTEHDRDDDGHTSQNAHARGPRGARS